MVFRWGREVDFVDFEKKTWKKKGSYSRLSCGALIPC